MQKYLNSGGNSAVKHFEIGPDFIKIEFLDDAIYLYDQNQPGAKHVEKMKALAIGGRGLNSYISTFVKKNYAKKIR